MRRTPRGYRRKANGLLEKKKTAHGKKKKTKGKQKRKQKGKGYASAAMSGVKAAAPYLKEGAKLLAPLVLGELVNQAVIASKKKKSKKGGGLKRAGIR